MLLYVQCVEVAIWTRPLGSILFLLLVYIYLIYIYILFIYVTTVIIFCVV